MNKRKKDKKMTNHCKNINREAGTFKEENMELDSTFYGQVLLGPGKTFK